MSVYIERDTNNVLERTYTSGTLLAGSVWVDSPIFDRLAAERFARPE